MTRSNEQVRAIKQTEEFLKTLLELPRIPKVVREEARRLLRHYPTTVEADRFTDAR